MRIPITITGPEDRLRRRAAGSPWLEHPRVSDAHGYRLDDEEMRFSRPAMRNRTNLAIDRDTEREDEVNLPAEERPLPEQDVSAPTKDEIQEESAGEEGPSEDWKNRYIRLRADFDNYKRHAEAQRDQLSGLGKAKVLEDIFPLVEHMERAIRAAEEAGDKTGILEGIKMVYQELLKALDKNGVERIETVGTAFDPEIHEAVAVSAHPEYPAGTVVEEVRAGFVRGGKLLRPASVIVAQ